MVEIIEDGQVGQIADFDNRYRRRDELFAIEREALTESPVIDISPFMDGSGAGADRGADKQATARKLRDACVNLGFFYLTGHGIPLAEFDRAVELSHRYFALPRDHKMATAVRGAGQTGYLPVGGINPEANPDKAADLKERFILISRELREGEPESGWQEEGLARWPDEVTLPGFAPFMQHQLAALVQLSRRLARAFALSLDLPEAHFDAMFARMDLNSIINWYPPLDTSRAERTQWSASPHTDYGAFTILSQDSLGGLQVRNSAGEWIDVPPIPGAFVVNIGDLMSTWTNDLYTSNLHRALNGSGKARVSIPLFVAPRRDTLVECLPTCQGPGNPPRYAPVRAGDYMRTLIEQARRTGRPGLAVQTAKRFAPS